MNFVLDASATIAFMFPDERDDAAVAVAKAVGEKRAIAPVLWAWELQNVMLAAERRGRLDREQATILALDAAKLPVRLEPGATFGDESAIARRMQISLYDAVYLELAFRTGLPLATRDQRLRTAAKALGVSEFRS